MEAIQEFTKFLTTLAWYHFGQVITGGTGDIKKEIAFHGDTVNKAARIRSELLI
jgi:hypothetical protein